MKIYRVARGRKGYKMEGEQRWRDRIERNRKLKKKHCIERQMGEDGWQGNKNNP